METSVFCLAARIWCRCGDWWASELDCVLAVYGQLKRDGLGASYGTYCQTPLGRCRKRSTHFFSPLTSESPFTVTLPNYGEFGY